MQPSAMLWRLMKALKEGYLVVENLFSCLVLNAIVVNFGNRTMSFFFFLLFPPFLWASCQSKLKLWSARRHWQIIFLGKISFCKIFLRMSEGLLAQPFSSTNPCQIFHKPFNVDLLTRLVRVEVFVTFCHKKNFNNERWWQIYGDKIFFPIS